MKTLIHSGPLFQGDIMKIECSRCKRRYQIPENLVGQTIRCLHCGEPIDSTTQPTVAITTGPESSPSQFYDSPVSPVDPSGAPPRTAPGSARRAWQTQKQTSQQPILKPETAKLIVLVICILAMGAVALMVAEWQWGVVSGRRTFSNPTQVADRDGPVEDSPSVDEPPANDPQPSHAEGKPDRPESKTGSSNETTRAQTAERPETTGRNRETENTAEDDDQPEPFPLADDYPEPVLGKIPFFDPTWDANQPLYSLRVLDRPELTGEVMEKIVRTYGAPPFIRRYRELLHSDDYTVQFYAAMGLANFGDEVVPSIRFMLKAIALSRSRPGYQIRLDLANQLIAHWRREAVPALFDLIHDPDADVKGAAIEYLALFGWESRPAVPAIASAVTDARPYVPMTPELKTFSIGQLAREALRRLGPQAVDALPTLLKSIRQMKPSPVRDELIRLAVEIRRAAGIRSSGDLPDWAERAGLQYLPDTLRYVAYCRPQKLIDAGMISKQPDWLEPLQSRVGIALNEIDLITFAWQNDRDSLWEKRPCLGVLRTRNPIGMVHLPAAKRTEVDGQIVHLVPGDMAYQRIGEHTLVFGTADEVLAAAAKRIRALGPPPVVMPRGEREPLYFRATPSWGVSAYEGTGRPEVAIEFEYGSPELARVAADLLLDPTDPDSDVNRLPEGWSALIGDASARWQLELSRAVTWISMPKGPGGQRLIDLKMWTDEKTAGVQQWETFAWEVQTERSPFSDAAGLIHPEMQQASDLYRAEVVDIVSRFLSEVGVDATTAMDVSGSQKKNIIRFLHAVATWADSRHLESITHFIDAIHLDPARAVAIYSRIAHRESIAHMAQRVENVPAIAFSDDTRQRLKPMLEHYLNVGDEPTVISILRICAADPWLATRLEDRIGQLRDDRTLAESTRQLAGDVRQMRQPFVLPADDYSRLERYAVDSGTANVGRKPGKTFRRRAPGIQKMLAFAHNARTFDVDLPHVDPELIRTEFEGPADESIEQYTRIDTLRYMIDGGDVVVAARREYDPDHVARDWVGTSAYLGSALVRDVEVSGKYAFDRRRDYVLDGTPKSQRIIQVGNSIFEVRWIGWNYNHFPPHVDMIIQSFSPRLDLIAAQKKEKSEALSNSVGGPDSGNGPAARLGSDR